MYCVLFPAFLGFITKTTPKNETFTVDTGKFVTLLLGKNRFELHLIEHQRLLPLLMNCHYVSKGPCQ